MPRYKQTEATQPLAVIGNGDDPNSLYHWMQRFLAYRAERHFSESTIEGNKKSLRYFIQWCDERGLHHPNDITKPILESYQRHIYHYKKKNGQPLSVSTQHGRVVPIKVWFKWLTRNDHLLYNPASELELPRVSKRLPKSILTLSEVETVINQPDTSTVMGMRDRAILETFYSTGMRRSELASLQLTAIDYERGTVFIDQGKGRKDRMLPIGDRALQWIEKYQYDYRVRWTIGRDDGSLFVNQLGEGLTPSGVSRLVSKYIQQADISKSGGCHLFRHTCATLMLENGADIRYIQALLGHSKLETTSIYTQVSIQQLKNIHTLTHPAKISKNNERPDLEV
jgi:integrase/recombinase XerD